MAVFGILFTGNAIAADCPKDLPTIEPGKLTMSINATIPPRQYIDDSGNLQGLHPDLGNEIAKRLCLEPAYMNVEFAVQIPGLATKRWDMVNTGMYYKPERAQISAPPTAAEFHDPVIAHIVAGEKFCNAEPARAWLNAIPPYSDMSGRPSIWNKEL